MGPEATSFARARRAYVIAPAGCGKTQLIAGAVAEHTPDARVLLLTHTHAGVHSLRGRLRTLGIPNRRYRLETLDGFALRIALSYPGRSGLATEQPAGEDWGGVRRAATMLLASKVGQDFITSSYDAVYVDEYQDCDLDQHAMVVELARLLPCKVVGDPLQGIFTFRGTQLVDWHDDVPAAFELLGDLKTPWRWRGRNELLGEWLLHARELLLTGDSLLLSGAPLTWAPDTPPNAKRMAKEALRAGTTVVIGRFAGNCHHFARNSGVQYRSMEELECEDLSKAAAKLDRESVHGRAGVVLDLAQEAIKGLPRRIRSLNGTTSPTRRRSRAPGLQKVEEAWDGAVAAGTPETLFELTQAISELPGIFAFRRELWSELQRSLATWRDEATATFSEAAWRTRQRVRISGRNLDRKVVSRPPLVKGLEFDHGVVLSADGYGLKELYVALTRASISLAVLSRTQSIMPATARRSPSKLPSPSRILQARLFE